jgi:RNA polymerase sigma factor (sigma-70 family)
LLLARYDCFDPSVAAIIRKKAKGLARHKAFTQSDFEDIEQELAISVLEALPNYRPDLAAKEAFVAAVCQHCCSTLLKRRSAKSRDWRRTRPLIDERDGDCDQDGYDRIATDHVIQQHNANPLHAVDHTSLRSDLQVALGELPVQDRKICELLMQVNVAESARRLKVKRYEVDKRIPNIARVFTAKKLGEYL